MKNVKNMVDKKKFFSKASSMSDFFVLTYVTYVCGACVRHACCVFRIKMLCVYTHVREHTQGEEEGKKKGKKKEQFIELMLQPYGFNLSSTSPYIFVLIKYMQGQCPEH